ncbi:MAG: alpha/beta fold hydrolase [Eubacterium sp.]|nr:alpha/beta fold hydrolase [Eubacterium sp.]
MNNSDQIKETETFFRSGEKNIFAKYYLPVERNGCPAIIFSHGFNGSGDDWERECVYFTERGFLAVAFDFCGGSMRSRSSGKPTDMTITSEMEDLAAVLDWVSAFEGVDLQRIYLLGGSQGGLVTALVAEEQKKRIAGMVLYYPGFCIPEIWQENYRQMKELSEIPKNIDFWGFTLGIKFVEDISCLSVYNRIGKFDKNVLIIHGTDDDVIPLEYSQKAVTYYKNGRLIVFPNEKHGFTEDGAVKAQKLAFDMIGG